MGFDVQRVLAGRLLPGERLLWTGRPKQGLLLVESDLAIIPFGLMWTGLLVWTSLHASMAREPAGYWMFLPFYAVGLYLLVGRLLLDAVLRRSTFYAVTDRRALIVREGLFGRFQAVNLANLADMDLRADLTPGGRGEGGTIVFGPRMENPRYSTLVPALDAQPKFLGVADTQKVFDLIQRTGARAPGTSSGS